MARRRSIRKRQQRRAKPVIWIIVEGETEASYLTGFRNDQNQPKRNPPVAIKIKCAGGKSPQNVIECAEKYRS